MAGIVEANQGAALRHRPIVECSGLGSLHVGFEAAEPKNPWHRAGPFTHSDPACVGPRSNLDRFQATITHSNLVRSGFRAAVVATVFRRMLAKSARPISTRSTHGDSQNLARPVP